MKVFPVVQYHFTDYCNLTASCEPGVDVARCCPCGEKNSIAPKAAPPYQPSQPSLPLPFPLSSQKQTPATGGLCALSVLTRISCLKSLERQLKIH